MPVLGKHENSITIDTSSVGRQSPWDHADRSRPQPSVVQIFERTEGDAVQLKVSVLFGLMRKTGSLEGLLKEPAGVYLVRPNESVILDGLRRFGFKRIEVKVVSAKPPRPVTPQIENETTSLLVERVDEDRVSYKLWVRNTSPLNVQSLAIAAPDGEGGRTVEFNRGGPSHPVIAAGALQEVSVGRQERTPEQLAAPPSEPPRIIIDAVVFDDGTYEGEAGQAAMLEAEQVGRERQGRCIAALVEDALENSTEDDAARLSSLRSQISALPEKADAATMDTFMARFPGLAEDSMKSDQDVLERAFSAAKQRFLDSLDQYEQSKAHRPGFSLQSWWDHWKANVVGPSEEREFQKPSP